MADYRFEDKVDMGRLTSPPHTDNTLRVWRSKTRITLQLRKDTWYMTRVIDRDEIVELIAILATELHEMNQELNGIKDVA